MANKSEHLLAEPCPDCGKALSVSLTVTARGGMRAEVIGDLCGCYPNHHDQRLRGVERSVIAAARAAEAAG